MMCQKCGYTHSAMGIEIKGGELFRRARASKHMLTRLQAGPSWAFAASIWDNHAGEFNRVRILDTEAGWTYLISAQAFAENIIRRDLGAGQQAICPISYFRTVNEHGELMEAASTNKPETVQAIAVQPKLFDGVKFDPARSKRPRRPMQRRNWGNLISPLKSGKSS
jgi:hypothetical protein